ncbi:hypothetical protein JCM16106_19180 [Hydrogenophilus islandicus]
MKLAAIAYRRGEHADTLLKEVVAELSARGVVIYGTVQHWLCVPDDPCAMALEILPSHQRINLAQDLGKMAQSCRLDPDALLFAAAQVRQALLTLPRPDLVVFSKFGELEAQGKGFRDEIALALEADVPVLTAVADTWRDAWAEFTGGCGELLPFSRDAVLSWCHRAGILPIVR